MSALQLKSNKKPWTSEEDSILLELVKEYGICGSWPKIALHMEWRSGKQCRERYINQLDPLIKKSMWTHEEDAIIKKMHHQVGKKWSKFMDHLPGRSDNAIKNRYHIISRDNYSDHNHHTTMKRAFELETIAKTEQEGHTISTNSSSFVPETVAIRLERFRSARDILDKKINDLLLEEEMRCDPNLDEEARCRNPLRHPRRLELLEEGNVEAPIALVCPADCPELDFDICSFGHPSEQGEEYEEGEEEDDDCSTSLSVSVSVSSSEANTPFAMAERHEFAEMSTAYSTYLANNGQSQGQQYRQNVTATLECGDSSPSNSTLTSDQKLQMEIACPDPTGYDFTKYLLGEGQPLTAGGQNSFGMVHQGSFGLSLSRQNSFGLAPMQSFGASRPNSFGGGALMQQASFGGGVGGPLGRQPSVGGGALTRQTSMSGGALDRQISVAGGALIRQPSVGGVAVPKPPSSASSGGGLVKQPSMGGGALARQSSTAGGPLVRQSSNAGGGALVKQPSMGGALVRQGSSNSVGYDNALDFLRNAGPSPRYPDMSNAASGTLFTHSNSSNSSGGIGIGIGVGVAAMSPQVATAATTLFRSNSSSTAPVSVASAGVPPRIASTHHQKPLLPTKAPPAPVVPNGNATLAGGRLDRLPSTDEMETTDHEQRQRRPSIAEDPRPVW